LDCHVISARIGLSFFTANNRSEQRSILKSASAAWIEPERPLQMRRVRDAEAKSF